MTEVWVDLPGRLTNGPFKALVVDGERETAMPLFRFDEAARVVFDNGGWFCHVTCKMCSPEWGNTAPPGKGPAWTWPWCLLPTGPGGALEVLWAIGSDQYEPWAWQVVEGPRASEGSEQTWAA